MIGATPLSVEITNHTDQLTLWLPAGITLLVAFIALGGVMWSNIAADKRSKQDREDARQRDFLLWKRDTLLRLGTEIMEAAIDTHDEYNRLAYSPEPISHEALGPLDRAGRRIAANAASLRLLSAGDTAERCVELRNAINNDELMRAVYELNAAFWKDMKSPKPQTGEELSDDTKAATAKFEDLRKAIKVAQTQVRKAFEHELRQLNSAE